MNWNDFCFWKKNIASSGTGNRHSQPGSPGAVLGGPLHEIDGCWQRCGTQREEGIGQRTGHQLNHISCWMWPIRQMQRRRPNDCSANGGDGGPLSVFSTITKQLSSRGFLGFTSDKNKNAGWEKWWHTIKPTRKIEGGKPNSRGVNMLYSVCVSFESHCVPTRRNKGLMRVEGRTKKTTKKRMRLQGSTSGVRCQVVFRGDQVGQSVRSKGFRKHRGLHCRHLLRKRTLPRRGGWGWASAPSGGASAPGTARWWCLNLGGN